MTTPDEYRWAAMDRITAAQHLHAARLYGTAIFVGGLAIECILRAYRTRLDPEFNSRHDLGELLRESKLQNYVPEKRRAEVAAALGDAWARWRNDYRYASDNAVHSDLRKRRLTRGITGDELKENSRIVLERAQYLVGIGVARWKNN